MYSDGIVTLSPQSEEKARRTGFCGCGKAKQHIAGVMQCPDKNCAHRPENLDPRELPLVVARRLPARSGRHFPL